MANRPETERRIDIVSKLLIAGLNSKAILDYVNQKENWNIQQAQLNRYLKRATMLIKTLHIQDREYQLHLAVNRLNDLYNRSFTIQDYKTCLQTQKELNNLQGLYLEDDIFRQLEEIKTSINLLGDEK